MLRQTVAIGSALGALALVLVLLSELVIGSAGVTESARYETPGDIDLVICHVPSDGDEPAQTLILPDSEALAHLDEHDGDSQGSCEAGGELVQVGGDPILDTQPAEPPAVLPNTGSGGVTDPDGIGTRWLLWLGLGIMLALIAALAGSRAAQRIGRLNR